MGIENEFQLYDADGNCVSAMDLWSSLSRQYPRPLWKTDYRIWTASGTLLYADGEEPEACTPPIRIRKGFVKEIVDAVRVARREVSDILREGDRLIGYSMHYNLSNVSDHEDLATVYREMMRAYAIPLSLFAINPLSMGVALRDKTDRHEFLGDHVPDEEQIGAFALLYAGFMLNHEKHAQELPFHIQRTRRPDEDENDAYIKNRVKKGRKSMVRTREGNEVAAQEYLEQYYALFREDIAELATSSDIALLEDFVYGRRELDIDRKEFYAKMKRHKQEEGRFDIDPALCLPSYPQVPFPVGELGQALGYLISHPEIGKYSLSNCGWDSIAYKGSRVWDRWFGFFDAKLRISEFEEICLLHSLLAATNNASSSLELFESGGIAGLLSKVDDAIYDAWAVSNGLVSKNKTARTLTSFGKEIMDGYRRFKEASA
jgi:hypothetical protein